MFVFGDFNTHYNRWHTYSARTDGPGELYYNFSISYVLTKMVNFPTRIPDCESHSPACLDLFISSDAGIYLQGSPLGNPEHVVSVSISVNLTFRVPTPCNGKTNSNNSLAVCQQIV